MRMREYAVHVMRIYIHIYTYKYLPKLTISFIQKWVSLALFSILCTQTIIIVHPSWFYPSSVTRNKSPEPQHFGPNEMIFFTIRCS